MNELNKMFCTEILELRKFTNATQKDFAETYRITLKTLQNWEQQVSVPSYTELYLLRRCIMEDTKNIGIKDENCQTYDYLLTDGTKLYNQDWNGEFYTINDKNYKPIQIPISYDDGEPDIWQTIGFELLY